MATLQPWPATSPHGISTSHGTRPRFFSLKTSRQANKTIAPRNPAVFCLIAAFHALALWTALSLILKTLLTFKKRGTLYCWAMLIVALGIVLETITFNGHLFYDPAATHAGMLWYSCLNLPATIMIRTGFGLILYSRLHIIKPDVWFTRSVLAVVIFLGCVEFAGNVAWMIRAYRHGAHFQGPSLFDIWIIVDILFPLQDICLSTLYLYFFWSYLNDVPADVEVSKELKSKCRAILALLAVAFVWVAATDVSMYVLQLTKWYLVRMMVLPFLEAVKLDIEFFVLNKLVEGSKMKQEMLCQLGIRISHAAPSITTHGWDGDLDPMQSLAVGPRWQGRAGGADLEKS